MPEVRLSRVDPSDGYPDEIEDHHLWLMTRMEPRDREAWEAKQTIEGPKRWQWRKPPAHPPQLTPITPWRELMPRLRRALLRDGGRRLDVPKLVHRMARGKLIRQLPRRARPAWAGPAGGRDGSSRRFDPVFRRSRLADRSLATAGSGE